MSSSRRSGKMKRTAAEERSDHLADEMPADGFGDSNGFPPRRLSHPSNRMKITKIIYLTLIILFVCLMVALIIFGSSVI